MADKSTLQEVMSFDAGRESAKAEIEELKAELAIKDKALELAIEFFCENIGSSTTGEKDHFIAKARESCK